MLRPMTVIIANEGATFIPRCKLSFASPDVPVPNSNLEILSCKSCTTPKATSISNEVIAPNQHPSRKYSCNAV